MSIEKIESSECTCERCNHKWLIRKRNLIPKFCPHCKSPYWNKAKTKITKNQSQSEIEPANI